MGSCGGVRLISAQSLLSSSITEGGCKLGKNWKVYFLPVCIFKRVSQCDVCSSMGTLKMTT